MAAHNVFNSPEEVLKAFTDYLQWCKDNPIHKVELLKSGQKAGETGTVKVDRIPTILGFCVFNKIAEKTFYNYVNNTKNDEMLQTFTYVRDYFRQEMQDAGVAGAANPAIAAMLLGLRQKHEVESATIDATGKTTDEILVAIRAIEEARKQTQ